MNKKEQKGKLTFIGLIGNIISWTALVLLIVVATFLLYYIITTQLSATKGDKYAPKFSMYTIVSPSMTPNINVYDIVIDKKVEDFSELKVGDVITFISTSSISNGMTITHRIVDIIETEEGTKYKTKGDNNLTADYSLVTQDKIIGKVKFRIPQLGRIQFFLSSKGGWLIIILIPALIIILSDIFKLVNLVGIKKRVKDVEDDANEEKLKEQEKREEELRKQASLKEKLQNKNTEDNNALKVEDTNNESDFTLEEKEVNTELEENVNEYINDVESDLQEAKDINIISSDNTNDYKQQNLEPENDIDSFQSNLNSLKAMLNEDDDEKMELPKTIQIKEEEIPDDIELPTVVNSDEDTLESVIDEYITKERIINIENVEVEENNDEEKSNLN